MQSASGTSTYWIHRRLGRLAGFRSIRAAGGALLVALATVASTAPPHVQAATILSANFNTDAGGFTYVDDPFLGTSQPAYASGVRQATGGYGGTGGLQVTLGGIDATTINGMSGGWSYTLNLATAQTGVSLSYRYKVDQTSQYEFDEYSRMLMTFDGVQKGRGSKDYVDHIGGDGSSTQGNSSSYLPTTDWQQHQVYLGNLAAGNHTLRIGGYNNRKNAADESMTVVIDDVAMTNGNTAPVDTVAETLVDRLDLNTYKGRIQSLAGYGDRCRMSSCPGSPANSFLNAQAWVAGQLSAMGYTPQYHNGTWSGTAVSNLYVTKIGTVHPEQMYIVSGHLDGRGGGGGADDDASGIGVVMEAARVLSAPDVQTDVSVRFIFWDREEVGLNGANAYVTDRRVLQGVENPAGSGLYPEPTWLGIIQHDMVLYDHGAGTAGGTQSVYADLDVEWRAGTTEEADSKALALQWRYLNGNFSTQYPSTAYNYSTNSDDTAFHPWVASVSVRENRRSLTSGTNAEWINPNYHTTNDLYATYSTADFDLGFNIAQGTLGTVATLAGAQIVPPSDPPTADPQSVTTDEDAALAITLTGSDPENDPLTFAIVTQPSHGTLSGTAPNVTYTPAANYNGGDSFTFRVNDGYSNSPPATVSITVDPVPDPPVADAQTVTATQNTPKAITLTGSDPDNDPLTYAVSSQPLHGTLSGTAPALTSTPDSGYLGADSLAYTVNDGGGDSPPATVTINVNPPGPITVFDDGFETSQGWTVNPSGTDTATSGVFERANPEETNSSGVKQLGTTADGSFDMVTGPLAGTGSGSYDIDGGVTSVRSPDINLPSNSHLTLGLKYYLAHGTNSSTADYLRITVVGPNFSRLVVEELGGTENDNGAWATLSANLNRFAGQTVYLLVQAADASGSSLVEAAIDDVTILADTAPTVVVQAGFTSNSEGFSYTDDGFRGTNQPSYASGVHVTSGGNPGGALKVTLGGVNNTTISNMSGGWGRSITLAASAEVIVSLWYNLTQSPEYETDEYSQSLISVDGTLYGLPPTDYLAQVYGDGNGGSNIGTGWRLYEVNVGSLATGSHTVRVGGFNSKKTNTNEFTDVLIDDVIIATH